MTQKKNNEKTWKGKSIEDYIKKELIGIIKQLCNDDFNGIFEYFLQWLINSIVDAIIHDIKQLSENKLPERIAGRIKYLYGLPMDNLWDALYELEEILEIDRVLYDQQ